MEVSFFFFFLPLEHTSQVATRQSTVESSATGFSGFLPLALCPDHPLLLYINIHAQFQGWKRIHDMTWGEKFLIIHAA